jgi:hypothetical protein
MNPSLQHQPPSSFVEFSQRLPLLEAPEDSDKRPAFLKSMPFLPKYPAEHTYHKTPMYMSRLSRPEDIRERLSKHQRLIEEALLGYEQVTAKSQQKLPWPQLRVDGGQGGSVWNVQPLVHHRS